MRVIKEGKELEVEITCSGCQSILAYMPNDRRKKLRYGYDSLYDIFVRCPRCGKKIIINSVIYQALCDDIREG